MADAPPPGNVIPNYRTPRLLGIFNVVFASGLLICGLCSSVYIVVWPSFGKAMEQVTNKAEADGEARRKSELDAIAEEAKTAKTDEEKARIEDHRKEVESRPKVAIPGMMDFNKMGMNDPLILGWWWTEALTGLVLNVLLMTSGIGLLKYKAWARTLGIWTAALKITRLVLVYTVFTLVIVPPMSKKIGDMVGEMMAQQQAATGRGGAAPPADLFVKTYTVMYSICGVGMIVFGSIYPTVLLWLLTRPGVKRACVVTSKPPSESSETW